jgi:hypothetical protein
MLHFFVISPGRDWLFGIAGSYEEAREIMHLIVLLHDIRPTRYLGTTLHSTDGRISGCCSVNDIHRVINDMEW